jgi:hypothetical protein
VVYRSCLNCNSTVQCDRGHVRRRTGSPHSDLVHSSSLTHSCALTVHARYSTRRERRRRSKFCVTCCFSDSASSCSCSTLKLRWSNVISRRLEPEEPWVQYLARSRIAAYASVRHALPYVLVREQTTRLNTSWNDSGGSKTPGHVVQLLITLHRDQICQQPTQRTSAWRYGTGTILTIRILGLASLDRRKQVATRISRVYHIPQRDRQRCSATSTG